MSSGVVSARHYPELFAASEVRNELITVPAVGITHSRQTTVTAMRTDQPARRRRNDRTAPSESDTGDTAAP